ncbi:MAG: amidase family protein [Oscillospiraceae bacterium]|nr:amidase family protein [Oscillospiraceae bacterium]
MDSYLRPGGDAVALEDSIMQKGQPVTAGSKMLENFISPLDATVVERLRGQGVAIVGRARMTEFGVARISGDRPEGISGAVDAVADGSARWALCNDVFGINRRLAAQNGVCYIHPTYGTVSRYGLVHLASSMDQIGVVCRNAEDGFALLGRIAGKDANDGAMFPEARYDYASTGKDITVGLPEAVIGRAGTAQKAALREFAGRFRGAAVQIPLFPLVKQVMYILASAEISSNLTRYDGIKFGYQAPRYRSLKELYTNTRTEAFGLDAKLAAIMGTMFLSQGYYTRYYDKAMRLRRLVKESLTFAGYDVLALPCAIGDDPYENLSLYALAPLAGLPSLVFPQQRQGIQLIAAARNENALLTAWKSATKSATKG